MQLILDYEVGGGEAYYRKFLQHPTWPGCQSGVTIAIGYDLGFTPRAIFTEDWAGLDETTRDRLGATIGVQGVRAKARAAEVRDIVIPWEQALEVFKRRTIPRYVAQTRAAFPGVGALPWDAMGALVSLVFNRGPGMDGDRRREMRDIREAVQDNDIPAIARHIRKMKRLWTGRGLDGLLARREAEAALVEGAV